MLRRNKIVNNNYDVKSINERRYSDPYKDYDWDEDGISGEYVYGDGEWSDPEYGDELWKKTKVPGYWVSDYGRVYSEYTKKFIHGSPIGETGHIDLSLICNGKRKHAYLHRLVAEEFLDNPNNGYLVRHMDNDPSNNAPWNLKWGTSYDNVHDCIDSGRAYRLSREDIKKANDIRRTPIIAIDLRSGRETEYISQQEASRRLGMTQGSINRVLRGLSKHADGFYFYYVDDPKPVDISTYKYSRKMALIRAIDLETGNTYIFKGQTEAARKLGLSISSISCILSGKIYQSKGYTFEYIDEEDDDYDR